MSTPPLPRPTPNLDSLPLPAALKTAIRRLYQLLYDLRDDMLSRFAALPTPVHTFRAILSPSTPIIYFSVPVGGTITAWSILKFSGTATVEIWKVAAGAVLPVSTDTINTAGVSLATGEAIRSEGLSDFITTTILDHDILAANLITSTSSGDVYFQLEWI